MIFWHWECLNCSLLGLCVAVSGEGRVCSPGQQWKQCVNGAVSCTDLAMDLGRNCTPGCQCPHGTVQQVGGGDYHRHMCTNKCTVIRVLLFLVCHIYRMVCVLGSLNVAVTWMENSTIQEKLCHQTATTGTETEIMNCSLSHNEENATSMCFLSLEYREKSK